MKLHEDNLYVMNFIKVYRTDAVNLAQSWKNDGVLELQYC